MINSRRRISFSRPISSCVSGLHFPPPPGHGLPDDCQDEGAKLVSLAAEHRRKEVDDRGAFAPPRPRNPPTAPPRRPAGMRCESCRSRAGSRKGGWRDPPRIVPSSGSCPPTRSGARRGGRTVDGSKGVSSLTTLSPISLSPRASLPSGHPGYVRRASRRWS